MWVVQTIIDGEIDIQLFINKIDADAEFIQIEDEIENDCDSEVTIFKKVIR
jgi:hypothetical protein